MNVKKIPIHKQKSTENFLRFFDEIFFWYNFFNLKWAKKSRSLAPKQEKEKKKSKTKEKKRNKRKKRD